MARKTKSSLCLSLSLLSSSRYVVALDHNECVKIYTESHKTLPPGFEILLIIVTAYVDYDQQKLCGPTKATCVVRCFGLTRAIHFRPPCHRIVKCAFQVVRLYSMTKIALAWMHDFVMTNKAQDILYGST